MTIRGVHKLIKILQTKGMEFINDAITIGNTSESYKVTHHVLGLFVRDYQPS
jgi:hypothetical protein